MSIEELRKHRSGAQGHITRAITNITRVKDTGLAEMDLDTINRYEGLLNKYFSSFSADNREMLDKDAECTEEKHAEAEEEQECRVEKARKIIAAVKIGVQLQDFGLELLLSLEDLTSVLRSGYLPGLAPLYDDIEPAYAKFSQLYAKRGVADLPGARDLRSKITTLRTDALNTRNATGYDPRAPPPSVSAGSSVSTGAAPTVPKVAAIAAKFPKFHGQPSQFQDFKRLFLSILAEQTQLSEDSKISLLSDSMVLSEHREQVRRALREHKSFDDVMTAFCKHHENNREVVAHHWNAIIKMPVIHQTHKDVQLAIKYLVDDVVEIGLAKCTTAKQLIASYMDSRLDQPLQMAWRMYAQTLDRLPSTDDLRVFLDKQADIVHKSPMDTHGPSGGPSHRRTNRSQRMRSPSPEKAHQPPSLPPEKTVFQATPQRKGCHHCGEDHSIFYCSTFKEKGIAERQEWVKKHKRCYNCLSDRHVVADCKNPKRCQDCKGRHHTLLHTVKSKKSSDQQGDVTSCVVTNVSSQVTLPATAFVRISSGQQYRHGRIMLDSGADISIVSRAFATSLNAPHLRKPPLIIGGMGTAPSPYAVKLQLHGDEAMGREGDSLQIEARVVDSIPQPSASVSRPQLDLSFMDGCPLADPDYHPGDKIDLILGRNSFCYARTGGVRHGPDRGSIADETMFGWVIGGPCYVQQLQEEEQPQVLVTNVSDDHQDETMAMTWNSPPLPGDDSELTIQDARAEQVFQDTYTTTPDGGREVGMPTVEPTPVLGESRSKAVSRYLSLKKTLSRTGKWEAYRDAVNDFLISGHAERVPKEDMKKPDSETFYMPMHAVCKMSSTTTKIRPVCDASAESSTGVSYNDTLVAGPSLYHPLTSIITQFRDFAIAMVADVSRMYRRIHLRLADRDFHRFIFEDDQGVMTTFRMTTVTFGVKASPFCASRVLQQLALEQQEQHPLAAAVVKSSFYVDDVLTGAATVPQALHLREQLNLVLDSGNLPLCKWRSNSQELLNTIPPELRELSNLTLSSSPMDQQKALGVLWSTALDDMHVATPSPPPSSSSALTKRQLVSIVAQIYDPMGWFGPTLIMPKVLAQQAWREKLAWDEPLPNKILLPLQGWIEQLPSITEHPIHRPYGLPGHTMATRELHGFSDASERGYGGVVYLRTLYASGEVAVAIVRAKGRVAPLKELSIPRLELKGAYVLAHLLQVVSQDLDIDPSCVHAWSDSTIVLAWLKLSPARLMMYVGNRVRVIQGLLPEARWHHVPGRENPADCLSRGLKPQDLSHFTLWWHGPDWLKLDPAQWPGDPPQEAQALPDLKKLVLKASSLPVELGAEQQNFFTWIRVVAWIRRFCYNYLHPADRETSPGLSFWELAEARNCILRSTQRQCYSHEISLIKSGQALPHGHPLAPVTPFMGADGLLKVGGRLTNSCLPESSKHPIILHKDSHVVFIFIRSEHERLLHPPMSSLMATIFYTYHLPRLKVLLKSLCKRCVHCQRRWAKPMQQKMGDLPAMRSDPSHVFTNVGVDYAGPIYISRGRGIVRVKAYVAVFICLTTRAVHLEVAADATTASFLAVLDRFCGRRGTPSTMTSDNGSNFKGAASELQDIYTNLFSKEAQAAVSHWSLKKGLQWVFNPPGSPHRGGIWEAGVRVMKGLIRKQLHLLWLTLDELSTLIISAEAVMNSRPYVPIHSTDPEAFSPLTPAHFLIGRPLCALPQQVETECRISNLRHWDLIKKLQLQNWTRFTREYLPMLAGRAQRAQKQTNLAVNDVVLITNQHTRRNQWPLGRVTAIYPGPDGLVRTAEVAVETNHTPSAKSSITVYKRAIQYLVKMPIDLHQETTDP